MGRHRGSARHSVAMVVVLAAAAVLLAGGGAYAVWRAYDDSSPGGSPPAATARGGSSVGAQGVDPTGSTRSTPSSTSGTSGTSSSPPPDAVTALRRCVATVRAQESLATAVAGSAAHWRTHTDAQRRRDAGTFTVAQTAAAWARSKAKGPADLLAFATASAAVKQAGNGCADVGSRTAGSDLQARGEACAQRSQLLGKVGNAGTSVHEQWAAHLQMMAMKAHTDKAAYHDRWVQMVKDSGPMLASYSTAAAAAARAPTCTE